MTIAVICIVLSLTVSFFLTIQQINFAVVISSKTETEQTVASVKESILNGFNKKPYQFVQASGLAKLLFFSIFVFSCFIVQNTLFQWLKLENIYFWLIYALFFLVATLFYLFFCEFLARLIYNYAKPHNDITPMFLPLTAVYVMFYPWVSLFNRLARFWTKSSEVQSEKKEHTQKIYGISAFDIAIKNQFHEGDDTGIETQKQIIRNMVDLSSSRVKDIMVPRTEVVAVNIETTTSNELKSTFSESGFSRIIVYENDIDHVLGYIHSLEMFENTENWKEKIKETPFVPETMGAHDLMKDLMQKKKNMAVVVDEFGGTAGIITLEDLVEEIFGEIEDEHDKKSIFERKINDREFMFSGRMEIDYINENYDLDLPTSEDYVTLAGYLLFVNQRFPKPNQHIEIGNISYTILKMSKSKIELVKVVVEHPFSK